MIGLLLALHLSLPVFEGGPVLNVPPFAPHDEQAIANASAHAGWSLALPLVAGAAWGPGAAIWTGVCYCAAAVAWEALLHEQVYGRHHGPEVRTDLLTHCVPALLVALWYATKR